MKVGELVVGVYETVPRHWEQNSADGHELLSSQFLRSPVNLLRGQLVETALEKHMVKSLIFTTKDAVIRYSQFSSVVSYRTIFRISLFGSQTV